MKGLGNFFIRLIRGKRGGKLNEEGIGLIRQTGLFESLERTHLKKMIDSLIILKLPKGKQIVLEEDGLYIVTQGKISLYLSGKQQGKMGLNLAKADFFGCLTSKIHSLQVEAAIDTELVKIPEEILASLSEIDKSLKIKLKKKACEQSLGSLPAAIAGYNDLAFLIEELSYPLIKDLTSSEVIFNKGDKVDYVYLVLQGKVEFLIPHKKTKKLASLILHPGHLIGGREVLTGRQMDISAITQGHTRLLAIEGNRFKQYAEKKPDLLKLISNFELVYKLPLECTVEQYIDYEEISFSRQLMPDKLIDSNHFREPTTELREDKIPFSMTDVNVSKEESANFEKEDLNICDCMKVPESRLRGCIDRGMITLEELSYATKACTGCGSCRYKILEMLGENPWFPALIRKGVKHNNNICSFILKPYTGYPLFLPAGQHIIIQAKKEGILVQRPYTISGITPDGEVRITIKKEPQGLFSRWLIDDAPESFEVNITKPQGSFTLNLNEDSPALCFAGGIGITPFIGFAKTLEAKKINKKLRINYSASTENDFVLIDEFIEISKKIPSITFCCHMTGEKGRLTKESIIQEVRLLGEPDIYICGPDGFQNAVCMALQEIKFNPQKIHIEKFISSTISQK